MKNKIRIAIVGFIVLFILSIMLNQSFALGSRRTEEANEGAPQFSLLDLNSQKITLSDFKGKNSVLLFFWTTWCPHCLRYLKVLNNMQSELADKNIKLFAVNVREDKAKLERFSREKMMNYPVLLDKDAEVALKYGIFGVPTFVGIDKKGQIKFKKNYLPQGFAQELTE